MNEEAVRIGPHVVSLGNQYDGCRLLGPFESWAAAMDWIDANPHALEADYHIVKVEEAP